MYDPPPGYADMEADGENAPAVINPTYHELEVEGVGVIHARRPLPNSVPALAGAANAKISDRSRLDHLTLFIQNHLDPGEFVGLLAQMTDPEAADMPEDAMLRVSRAIATAGTARPT